MIVFECCFKDKNDQRCKWFLKREEKWTNLLVAVACSSWKLDQSMCCLWKRKSTSKKPRASWEMVRFLSSFFQRSRTCRSIESSLSQDQRRSQETNDLMTKPRSHYNQLHRPCFSHWTYKQCVLLLAAVYQEALELLGNQQFCVWERQSCLS